VGINRAGYNIGVMSHYEVEIKSLLGEQENAVALKERMLTLDPSTVIVSQNKQLNHYFEGGDVQKLYEATKHLFDETQLKKFEVMATRGKNFSVRSRQKDDEVLLVVKASVDEGTSENTVLRMEFEEPVALSLADLDQLVLESGYRYQAKWSREREEYVCKDINVCLDKNAGYGYLAEFEKIVADESGLSEARKAIDELMNELEVLELSQERLGRMFDFYNQNWADYYGTDKTFNIE
jgi:predicted adenylyl cyclase CyaB